MESAIEPGPLGVVLLRIPDLPNGPRVWNDCAWPLPEFHLASVGIKAMPRTLRGRNWLEWRQTKAFELQVGSVFYSYAPAYVLSVRDLLGLEVQALQIRVVVPDKEVVDPDAHPDPGKVDFDRLKMTVGGWRTTGTETLPFRGFIEMLLGGVLPA